ncbi:hypothetical protein EV189_1180 [Motilibacter rhizosphaerae]|uniref:Uncharacterized protein n=2 Tax=Motilibacter rhizosphaerae TaxID=598652 RepID=A0A4Q7NQU1_9ACTN|nr:hypothetical protein EV189_1180 [Motilibacter rhizosphaerae]
MVVVMGMALVLTLVVSASLFAVTRQAAPDRRTQDYQAALAAAQAGLDDYVSRLNACDTYWLDACGAPAGSNAALVTASAAPTTWARVPDTSGVAIASFYQYSVLTRPSSGLLRIRVTGRVNGVRRTLTADLRKERLLNLIYYTTYETLAPALYPYVHPAGQIVPGSDSTHRFQYQSAISASTAAACEKFYYNGRNNVRLGSRTYYAQTYNSNSGQWTNSGGPQSETPTCDTISFGGGDKLTGHVHSEDAMSIGAGGITFQSLRAGDVVGSNWPETASIQPSNPNKVYYGPGDPVMTCTGCMTPQREDTISLPPSNAALVSYADKSQGGEGCLYTGPTKLAFNADGSVSVTSPGSSDASVLNSGCGSASALASGGTATARPANGVIYVRGITSGGCSSTQLGYTLTAAESCLDGNAFVSGSVSGHFTVGAQKDVDIVGNTTYAGGTSSSSTDSLGLIGNGFVQVYHPVTDSDGDGVYTNDVTYSLPSGGAGIEVDAALLSVQGSITVQNYNKGPALGTLRLVGALAQKFRGPVASTSSGSTVSGFVKDYRYDSRLVTQPPPFFLDPTSARWQVQAVAEQANP